MIDLESYSVAEIPFGEYLSRTFERMSAGDQLLGGPEKYCITFATFQMRVNFGCWCSWMQPSAWPNSWRTTREYSVSSVLSLSQPKFIVGWCFGKYCVFSASRPTADHEPGSALNEMRISAGAASTNFSLMLAYFSQCCEI